MVEYFLTNSHHFFKFLDLRGAAEANEKRNFSTTKGNYENVLFIPALNNFGSVKHVSTMRTFFCWV